MMMMPAEVAEATQEAQGVLAVAPVVAAEALSLAISLVQL